jgi:hypothetical protein
MYRLPLIVASFVALWALLLYVSRPKAVRIILIIVGLIIAFPLSIFSLQWAHELHMMWRARGIEAQIENYRASHGSYPVSLLEIEMNEVNGSIYYELDLERPSAYHLWFGTGFGTVASYDSKTRTWRSGAD